MLELLNEPDLFTIAAHGCKDHLFNYDASTISPEYRKTIETKFILVRYEYDEYGHIIMPIFDSKIITKSEVIYNILTPNFD